MVHFLLPAVVVLLVLFLAFRFYIGYAKPSKAYKRRMSAYLEEIKKIDQKEPINALSELFSGDDGLKSNFASYQKTLHPYYEVNELGEQVFAYAKSTQPAEVFFSTTNLVDLPLKLDYYRHLPGLLTGIGIVGTFVGLILGLSGFNTSGSPELVQRSLDELMMGVMWAFVASGSAIGISMFITYYEKARTREHYALLAEFNADLDILFTPELTETYLEKLVVTAQQNLTQSTQLKDAFVDDLKKMLTTIMAQSELNQQNMTKSLGDTYEQAANQMAVKVSESLGETLKEPLQAIAQGVGKVSQDQGSAVNTMLTDVLSAFMGKLEQTFGGQMQGIAQMLTQSSDSMAKMQQGITALIGEMRQAGQDNTDTMALQMKQLVEDIQVKQQLAQEKLLDILSRVAEKGEQTNDAMGAQLNEVLANVSNNVTTMMSNFGANQQQLSESQVAMTTQLQDQTQHTLTDMQQLMTGLIEVTQASIEGTKDNIQQISKVSVSAIDGMNMGANKLDQSIDKVTVATEHTHTVIDKAANLINEVNTITGALSLASDQIEGLLNDYQSANQTVSKAMQALESVMASSSGQIGNSAQMLKDMQALVLSLQTVEVTTQSYVHELNKVLGTAFDQFQQGTFDSLTRTLGKFDGELEMGTKYLSGVVQELSEVVEGMSQIHQATQTRQ